jgi:hypothetical protein
MIHTALLPETLVLPSGTIGSANWWVLSPLYLRQVTRQSIATPTTPPQPLEDENSTSKVRNRALNNRNRGITVARTLRSQEEAAQTENLCPRCGNRAFEILQRYAEFGIL